MSLNVRLRRRRRIVGRRRRRSVLARRSLRPVAPVATMPSAEVLAAVVRRRRLTALRVGAVIHDAEIMLGVLIEGLRRHAIATRGRVAGQGEILLVHLTGIAADPTLRPAAFETAGAGGSVVLSIGPTARPTPVVGTLSHASLHRYGSYATRIFPGPPLWRCREHNATQLMTDFRGTALKDALCLSGWQSQRSGDSLHFQAFFQDRSADSR